MFKPAELHIPWCLFTTESKVTRSTNPSCHQLPPWTLWVLRILYSLFEHITIFVNPFKLSGVKWLHFKLLIFLLSGTLVFRTEAQSARMSKNYKDGLDQYGTERFGRLIFDTIRKKCGSERVKLSKRLKSYVRLFTTVSVQFQPTIININYFYAPCSNLSVNLLRS